MSARQLSCAALSLAKPPSPALLKHAALLQLAWSHLPLEIRAELSGARRTRRAVSTWLGPQPADTKEAPLSATRGVCHGRMEQEGGGEAESRSAEGVGAEDEDTLHLSTHNPQSIHHVESLNSDSSASATLAAATHTEPTRYVISLNISVYIQSMFSLCSV